MNLIMQHPALYILAMAVWFAIIIGVSLLLRSRKRPLFPDPLPAVVRFDERWTSGHSLRSPITRLGGARNCLRVSVTENEIWIRLESPFNLLPLPDVYNLEHRIEAARVTSLGLLKSRLPLARARVRVDYADAAGGSHSFELLLRNPDQFMQAVEQMAPKAISTGVSPDR